MLGDKRRKKIIDFKTQSLIALEIMLHALLLPLVVIIFLAIDPFSTLFSNQSAETHFLAAMELLELNSAKWPILILILMFIGFLSIIFSHHIAGPSLKFKRTFMAMAGKDLTKKVVLRKWDYLQNMSTEFNNMLETLNIELKTVKDSNEQIAKLAEKMSQGGSSSKEEVDQILAHAKKTDEIISKYKLI